jgi:uncharacterized protein YkwD
MSPPRIPSRLRHAAVLLLTLVSGICVADTRVARASEADVRSRVVELVNDARSRSRRCGKERFAAVPALRASAQLDKAALGHARDMARKGFFDHRAPDGSQPWDRVKRAGYRPRISGENIAYGPESAEEVVEGWLDSPGHCANIMEPRFKEIGVGVATSARRGRIYWVQTFGAPLMGRGR